MDEEKKEQEEKAVKPEVVEEQKAEENKEESKGMSIAALILGIVSLVMLCIWYISIPCSILAIIFGILGRKKGGKGMGTAGLVLGIITVAFLIMIYILFEFMWLSSCRVLIFEYLFFFCIFKFFHHFSCYCC